MKKQLFSLIILIITSQIIYAQAVNIYQPNGSTTNFAKIVAADSSNYYVINNAALTLMKIDGNNNATLVTTLTAAPPSRMIWNNGKGIFPVAAGSPYKLFDGTNQSDISGGQLPMVGSGNINTIVEDYFHKGNYTYFRTTDKIYKTDFSTAASIQTLATRQSTTANGILEMQHTTNSIIYSEVVSTAAKPAQLLRINLLNGLVNKIDSSANGTYDFGIVYNNEYYYCTPFATGNISEVSKITDNGSKTVLYTETATNKKITRLVGVTPNGIIAIMQTSLAGSEYVSIHGGIVTSLNFNTLANPLPYPAVDPLKSRSCNTLVYFMALDTLYTVSNSNQALWVTDGTLAGTKKIMGGNSTSFGIGSIYPLSGFAEHCGNDLYVTGRKDDNGSFVDKLLHVNGNNYTVDTYTLYTSSTADPSVLKTSGGIYMIARPTSASAKAVFKISCNGVNAVEEIADDNINFDISPNPANADITVNLSDHIKNSILTIYNLLGDIMYKVRINDESTKINLNLKPGIYVVTVINNKCRITKKLIVE